MLIYSAILATTIIGSGGPAAHEEFEYPSWSACVKAEQLYQQRIRQAELGAIHHAYPGHFANGAYQPKPSPIRRPVYNKVQTYCRMK